MIVKTVIVGIIQKYIKRTKRRLFQKGVLRTKFDIYVFIYNDVLQTKLLISTNYFAFYI